MMGCLTPKSRGGAEDPSPLNRNESFLSLTYKKRRVSGPRKKRTENRKKWAELRKKTKEKCLSTLQSRIRKEIPNLTKGERKS